MSHYKDWQLKGFDVQISPERRGWGHEFKVTGNGHQWTAITFKTPEEIQKAIDCLTKYLEEIT